MSIVCGISPERARLFQVRGRGVRSTSRRLRTIDAVPGNLPVQATRFVGHEVAVKELTEQVHAHRLVTLTGVGGVGKTRLAMQVAAELTGEFPDGVWLVEFAPVGDQAAVHDDDRRRVGCDPRGGGRRARQHHAGAVGAAIVVGVRQLRAPAGGGRRRRRASCSPTWRPQGDRNAREGLRLPDPSTCGRFRRSRRRGDRVGGSGAVRRTSQGREPGVPVGHRGRYAGVIEICRRLDGIALAIELAAARMVSMSAQDVHDRLGDRFRLLSGSRRGLERHQTLHHTVAWSYDLLDDDERTVLQRCSVFAGGFDVAAATAICEPFDDYTVLDGLDSLVRKSLVTVERVDRHARYGMLETIRQFAEEQLAATDTIDEVRDRHAGYFAEQAIAHWDIWDGPGYDTAIEWVDTEFANLHAGFRWAADHADLPTAAAIAAHTAMLAYALQRFNRSGGRKRFSKRPPPPSYLNSPVSTPLPRMLVHRAPRRCPRLHPDRAHLGGRSPLRPIRTRMEQHVGGRHHYYAGRTERYMEVCAGMTAQPGLAHVLGLSATLYALAPVGRPAEAMAIAEDTVAAARAYGNPYWIAWALTGYGRAFAQADPARALDAFRQGLAFAREHRLPHREGIIGREAAGLEAVHGEIEQALALFDTTIDSFHRAGNIPNLADTLAYLAVFFDRFERAEIAATVYGASTRHGISTMVMDLARVVDHLRSVLGQTSFDRCVATGAAMEPADAVAYARDQIQAARRQIADAT